jgi:hypothetical protein
VGIINQSNNHSQSTVYCRSSANIDADARQMIQLYIMESRSNLQGSITIQSSSTARVASSRKAWPAAKGLQVRASKAMPLIPRPRRRVVAPSPEQETATLTVMTTARPGWAQPMRVWEPLGIFTATFVVLAALVPRMITYLNPVTGDEPYYLMTALSLLQDGDLNECNNYRALDEAKLYPAFYAGTNTSMTSSADPFSTFAPIAPPGWQGWAKSPFPLAPHEAKLNPASRECMSTYSVVPLPADGSQSELYSKHGLGLTLLVLPAFAFFGRIGVVLFLVMLAALLATNVYLVGREATGKVPPAVLTWVAFVLAAPFFAYSFLIFPEMAAGLLVLYAFRRIRLWYNNSWEVAGIGACLAFLPWLHYRFLPFTLGLLFYYVYQARRHDTERRLLSTVLVLGQLAVSAGLLMVFFYHRYGQVFPDTSDHTDRAGVSDFAATLRGAVGLMLDEQWGLLVYAPIFILAFVGLILMSVKSEWRKELLWVGVLVIPYYLLMANYAQWWGEWGPPARYLVSVLPLLALPFALSLDWIRSILYKAIYALLMLPTLLVTFAFAYQPQWMYSQPRPWCGSSLFQIGVKQLFPWLFGPPDPADLACADIPRRDFRGDGLLPSFVAPYYMFKQDKSGYYGPLFSTAAWRASIGPAMLIVLIVGISLLLAIWQSRNDSVLDSGVDNSQVNLVQPKRPVEEVPQV